MTGIITRIPSDPINAAGLVKALWGYPVSPTHRWDASSLPTGVVASWKSRSTGAALARTTPGSQPTVVDDGIKSVTFDGNDSLNGLLSLSGTHTMLLVMRDSIGNANPAAPVLNFGGSGNLVRRNNVGLQWLRGGTSFGVDASANALGSGWRVVMGVFSPGSAGSSLASVGDVETLSLTTMANVSTTELAIPSTGTGTGQWAGSIAHIAVWNGVALDAPQRAAARSAVRAALALPATA